MSPRKPVKDLAKKHQPKRGKKRIIVCIDGTWNNYYDYRTNEHTHWSNVHKVRTCIAERDGRIPQITLYFRGVGTSHYFDRLIGGATGEGINEQV